METVGILGGSFNPVHIGHMVLASYLTQWGYVDRIWLTLSPRNPLKDPGELLPDLKRLQMLSIAAKSAHNIDICDVELARSSTSGAKHSESSTTMALSSISDQGIPWKTSTSSVLK